MHIYILNTGQLQRNGIRNEKAKSYIHLNTQYETNNIITLQVLIRTFSSNTTIRVYDTDLGIINIQSYTTYTRLF